MARGFIKGGVIKSSSMVATDPLQSRREVFKSFDVPTVTSNIEVFPDCSWGSCLGMRLIFPCVFY
jgi:hypothetical protein